MRFAQVRSFILRAYGQEADFLPLMQKFDHSCIRMKRTISALFACYSMRNHQFQRQKLCFIRRKQKNRDSNIFQRHSGRTCVEDKGRKHTHPCLLSFLVCRTITSKVYVLPKKSAGHACAFLPLLVFIRFVFVLLLMN